MVMTNEEIVRDYLQARNKSKQIKILADLNQTTPGEIRRILAEVGVEGVAAPKRPRKTPPPPRADSPEVYRKIEDILAELPPDMGSKARWAAGKMLAEVFAEYLIVRLGLAENGGNDGSIDE